MPLKHKLIACQHNNENVGVILRPWEEEMQICFTHYSESPCVYRISRFAPSVAILGVNGRQVAKQAQCQEAHLSHVATTVQATLP